LNFALLKWKKKNGNCSSRETGPDSEAGTFLFPQILSRWGTSYHGTVSKKKLPFSANGNKGVQMVVGGTKVASDIRNMFSTRACWVIKTAACRKEEKHS
jgi:hypothetical protein